ncbi:transglutaminase-like domain-containing protein [uncultured Paludibaculum sp.]|uniref:transglutaminase-like domain-containing protein n=1 Tax=uncultured Paludibaculum sp. TaxID=1765020 RepID=UPI002AAACE22|nr:transglutaminase-like domain-containing protein [uncultured Paludibaculum sp.]
MQRIVCALLAPALLFSTEPTGPVIRQSSIVLDKPDAEYTIQVGGTMDPENLEVTIENLGDTPLVNPRLTVNGLYDWFDAKTLAAEITRDARTDEEKAIAIWWWVRYRTFQRSPRDESAVHPIRAMNGYGYGICGHVAGWMKALWTAAGLRARVQELWGHTVSEVYYNDAWHMLDGNVKVFYLDKDNRTIASLATLEHNKALIERTIHPRELEPWYLGLDTPERNLEFVRYLTSYKDNYEEHSYDSVLAKDYSMAMNLKPGETLVRWWTPRLGKFEGRESRAEQPKRYANGQLIWEPDLTRVDMRPYLSVPGYGNIATRAEDKQSPAIHVADLQDELYDRPSVFTLPIESPYPVLGGRFNCTLIKGGHSDLDMATINFGRPGWDAGDLYVYRWDSGPQKIDLDLDAKLARSGVQYKYELGFSLRGNAHNNPPTQAGVEAFRSETDLQVAPESLPALSLGSNRIHFRQESKAPGKVRITFKWREVNGPRPPALVTKAISAGDGAEVQSLAPLLRWAPSSATHEGGSVADYQVMVSLRPDCRWPLSTTLHRNIGSPATEWTVPAGFLNAATTYYWKVRARDNHGHISEWGPVFQFRTAGTAR